MRRLRGSVNQRRFIFIADTSSTTGAGLANLTHSSSGLVAYYIAGDSSNEEPITLVSGTLGTYVSGGFVAVDNTNMPGWYEVGIPDAALDGGNQVAIQYRGAANMAPVNIYIELDAVDYQDSAAFGLSRLDQTVGSRMASYTQPTGFLTATFPTTVASTTNITSASGIVLAAQTHTGAVIPTVTAVTNAVVLPSSATINITGNITGNVTGSVGSISGVTFPTHFDNLVISANGHVTATVDSINNNAITASSIQANALTAAKFAADSITASALATDAVNEIRDAVAALQVLIRLDSMIESDGAGQFRFDTIAVSLASQGGGGGAVNISVEDQSITVC